MNNKNRKLCQKLYTVIILAAGLLLGSMIFAIKPTQAAGPIPFETTPTVITNTFNTSSLAVADLDGDEDMDVIGGNTSPGRIIWLENANGDATVWTPTEVGSFYTEILRTADMNGDDYLDIVSGGSDDINWWRNTNGDGTVWNTFSITNSFYSEDIHAADIDGDDDFDVVGSSINSLSNNAIRWWENTNQAGTAWTTHSIRESFETYDIYLADINNNGHIDVVYNRFFELGWQENAGNGDGQTWTTHRITSQDQYDFLVADIEGNGYVDAISGGDTFQNDFKLAWWKNPIITTVTAWSQKTTISNSDQKVLFLNSVDLDRDDDLDIVGYKDVEIIWWENNTGNGSSWTRRVITSTFTGATAVLPADMDGDLDIDIVGASSGGIFWWKNLTPIPAADLAISLAGPVEAPLGTVVSYTITVQNLSDNAASNLVVTHTLPTGIDYSSASVSPAGVMGQKIVWTFSQLAGFDSIGLIVTGTVNSTALVGTALVATATVTSNDIESNAANNTANFTSTLVAGPAVTLVLTPASAQVNLLTPFTLAVKALDQFGNVDTHYELPVTLTSTVSLKQDGAEAGLSHSLIQGAYTFPGLTLNPAGTHWITATAGSLTASTPITVDNATVVIDGYVTWAEPHVTLGDLLVMPGRQLVLKGATIITANNIIISGTISADGQGYQAGQGPGAGQLGAVRAGGGGYGGRGGDSAAGSSPIGTGGDVYGDYKQPTYLGSGGATVNGNGLGGYGGGAIRLIVSNTIEMYSGYISANGYGGTDLSGGGAGGSIWIQTQVITGAGGIRANGGKGGYHFPDDQYYGGGGGGGRIAIYADTYGLDSSAPEVKGGKATPGAQDGAPGSIYLNSTDPYSSTLVVSPTTVVANGQQTGLVTVTLLNNLGSPVEAQGVKLKIEPAIGGLINGQIPPNGELNIDLTNAAGVVTATVASTKIGQKTISAQTLDNEAIVQTASITFQHGSVDAATSIVVAIPDRVAADGLDEAAITITARDALGNPVPDATVILTSTAPIHLPQPLTTNANGQATGVVTGTYVGQAEIEAIVDGLTLNDSVNVIFSGANIVAQKSGPYQVVPGQSILYNVTIKNNGLLLATGLVVTDTLPISITYVTHSAPVTPAINGSQIVWQLTEPLTSGTSLAFALVGQVTETVTAGQTVQNIIEASSLTADEDSSNNVMTATATVVAPYSHTLTLSPDTITARIGAAERMQVRLDNTGPLADVYTVTVTGLDQAWYTPITRSFALNPGAFATTDLALHVEDCNALSGATPFTMTVHSQEGPNLAQAAASLTVLAAPQQVDLTPANGSKTGSRSQLFSWRTDAPTTGLLTLWPTGSPSQTITRTTSLSTVHAVLVSGLISNTHYTWAVASESGCGHITASPTRTFEVSNGIVFDQHTMSRDVLRDYGQMISMTVRNEDSLLTHTLRVTVEHPYQDLIVGFIGPGSIDDGEEYIILAPSATQLITLAVHAQDAEQVDYALTAKVIADEASSDPIVDYAQVNLRVLKANNFTMTLVSEDPDTLVKTYQVKNLGFPITDLNIQALDPATGLPARALIQPTLNHARLAAFNEPGDAIQFQVIPIFSPDDAIALQALSRMGIGHGLASPLRQQTGFDIKVVATVLDVTQQTEGSYACQSPDQLYAVTLHNVLSSYTNNDWYCTNRPSIDLNFATPGSINLDDILGARVSTGFNPAPGWSVRPHDVRLLFNGSQVGELLNQVPQGSYTFDLNPAWLNPATNPVQPVNQTLGIRTTHMNGGHYVVNTASRLDLILENYTRYVCAENPEEARDKAEQGLQPNPTQISIEITQPSPGDEPEQNEPVTLRAEVDDNLAGQSQYPVQAVITYTRKLINGSPHVELVSLGYTSSAGDSDIYQVTWRPTYPGPVTIKAIVDAVTVKQESEEVGVNVLFLTDPPPPDPIPTEHPFKGAGWLRYVDDPDGGTDYKSTNVGWNVETAPDIRSSTVLQTQIANFAKPEFGVDTIVRLDDRDREGGPNSDDAGDLNSKAPLDKATIDLAIQQGDCTKLKKWMDKIDTEYEFVIGASPSVRYFILGNEPNHFRDEWDYTAQQYAFVYNCYYTRWLGEEVGDDQTGRRPHYLFITGPGHLGPIYQPGPDPSKPCEGQGAQCGDYNSFYTELLPLITDTDGFAIHAYGYYEEGYNGGTDIEGTNDNGFIDWLNAGINTITTSPLSDKPIVITEYNPGAEPNKINLIKKGRPITADDWQEWFEKTYCWVQQRAVNAKIRGLVYYVDEQDHWRNPIDKPQPWLTVSLFGDPDRRQKWIDLDPSMDCTSVIGQLSPSDSDLELAIQLGQKGYSVIAASIGQMQSPQTPNLIGGVITGTLGVWGHGELYYVTSDLEVPTGQTLTIEAGTTLVFSPGQRMTVAGKLITNGNTVFPVRFISPNAAGWEGIYFLPSAANSTCAGCYLENLHTGGVAIQIEAPITFREGLIRDVPMGTGISSTVPITLSNAVIDYVATGIQLSGQPTQTHHISLLTLTRCEQGVVNQSQTLALDNSIITTCGVAVSTELSGTTMVSYTLLSNNAQDFITRTGSQLSQGPGLLNVSPDFVDFPDNFNLRPDSPAVNVADPQADYKQELGYNGGRADLGAYGNTWRAPQQPPLEQMVVALEANTPTIAGRVGEILSYTLTLRNSGSVTDTYAVSAQSSDYRFVTSFAVDHHKEYQFANLSPQEQISVIVWVQIPTSTLSLSNTISVRAIGEYGVQTEIALITLISSFHEANGQVVMEAEHFVGQTNLDNQAWITRTTLSGYVGPSYIGSLSDKGVQITTTYTTTSPELRYSINFTTTGVYTVWVRGYAPDGAGDSIYISLDEQTSIQTPTTAIVLTGFSPREWDWAAEHGGLEGLATFEVTNPGLYTLHIWQREDGLRLDRIVLTTNNGYNPTGDGPTESELW